MFDYHRENDVDIRVARIFNTYGPRMRPDDGRVVSNFILQALREEEITIFGDGSQTRSFCFVSDMVEGLVRLMEQDDIAGPVNLGNPDERSIKDVAEKMNVDGRTVSRYISVGLKKARQFLTIKQGD